ncbi:hypothetical protein CYMTET_27426, partial [Cymbomonas tetramitiformis]
MVLQGGGADVATLDISASISNAAGIATGVVAAGVAVLWANREFQGEQPWLLGTCGMAFFAGHTLGLTALRAVTSSVDTVLLCLHRWPAALATFEPEMATALCLQLDGTWPGACSWKQRTASSYLPPRGVFAQPELHESHRALLMGVDRNHLLSKSLGRQAPFLKGVEADLGSMVRLVLGKWGFPEN